MTVALLQGAINETTAVIGAALAVGAIVFQAGFTYSQLKWLKENAATKSDVQAIEAKLNQKQDVTKCQEQFLSCRAARQMAEMDLNSRMKEQESRG